MKIKTKKRKIVTDEQSLSTEKVMDEQEELEQEYQRKHDEYKQVLLNSCYSYRDQQAYEQNLGKILRERISGLRKIFSRERFIKGEKNDVEQAAKDYDLCLYKIFLGFATTEEELKKKKCWAILDWLNDNGIEQILAEQEEPQMIECLISTSNQMGVTWALEKYQDSQLLQIFTNEQKKLFNLLSESIQETGNKEIADIVMARSRKIFKTLAEQKEKLEEQINQTSIMLQTIGTSNH